MREYHKIETLFERDSLTKKLIVGEFRNETVRFLRNNEWEFTEKIDGTNIRVVWDGHKVSYYGRTDSASIPSLLMNRLISMFGGDANEQLFEQKFGETPVMLIGEGFGEKIQKVGSDYTKGQDFILFDVLIGENYQPRKSVEDIAQYFGIKTVPIVFTGDIEQAVWYVRSGKKSTIGTAPMEGLVGRPKVEMRDRCGRRVIVKIKASDFKDE